MRAESDLCQLCRPGPPTPPTNACFNAWRCPLPMPFSASPDAPSAASLGPCTIVSSFWAFNPRQEGARYRSVFACLFTWEHTGLRSFLMFYTIWSSLGFQQHDHFPTFTSERMDGFTLDSQGDSQLYKKCKLFLWVQAQSCPSLCDPMDCIACQAPLSMGFSRQEYWVGSHFLLQGIFLTQGSNPLLLCLLHWQGGSLPLSHLGRPLQKHSTLIMVSGNICLRSKKRSWVYFPSTRLRNWEDKVLAGLGALSEASAVQLFPGCPTGESGQSPKTQTALFYPRQSILVCKTCRVFILLRQPFCLFAFFFPLGDGLGDDHSFLYNVMNLRPYFFRNSIRSNPLNLMPHPLYNRIGLI